MGKDFQFTKLKLNSIEDQVEKTETPEAKKLIEGKKSPSSAAAERLRAMQQHRLISDTVNVGGPIPYSEFEDFNDILNEYKKEVRYQEDDKKVKWTQKKLAAHYILEGIAKDRKKIKK